MLCYEPINSSLMYQFKSDGPKWCEFHSGCCSDKSACKENYTHWSDKKTECWRCVTMNFSELVTLLWDCFMFPKLCFPELQIPLGSFTCL